MIQTKCIHKFRKPDNTIIGYRLIDLNGKTQDVDSKTLKNAIRNKSINVVNLTLTQDNRLVDKAEEKLTSNKLVAKNNKIDKEFTLIQLAEKIKTKFISGYTYNIKNGILAVEVNTSGGSDDMYSIISIRAAVSMENKGFSVRFTSNYKSDKGDSNLRGIALHMDGPRVAELLYEIRYGYIETSKCKSLMSNGAQIKIEYDKDKDIYDKLVETAKMYIKDKYGEINGVIDSEYEPDDYAGTTYRKYVYTDFIKKANIKDCIIQIKFIKTEEKHGGGSDYDTERDYWKNTISMKLTDVNNKSEFIAKLPQF